MTLEVRKVIMRLVRDAKKRRVCYQATERAVGRFSPFSVSFSAHGARRSAHGTRLLDPERPRRAPGSGAVLRGPWAENETETKPALTLGQEKWGHWEFHPPGR